MRRVIVVAVFAACGGFCLASISAFGYAKLNAWRDFGEKFQLGYVVGYLDAVALAKRHDKRVWSVPSLTKPQYERWRDLVNAFYQDPVNGNRSLPDAMAVAGGQLQEEAFRAYREQQDGEWAKRLVATPAPSPSAGTPQAKHGTDGSGEGTPAAGAPTAAPGAR